MPQAPIKRVVHACGFLLLAALLVACGHPIGVMQPVAATAPQASIEDLFVITTRKPSGDPKTLYSGQRDKGFSFDEIKVSIPPESKRKVGEVQWPRRLPPDPATDFAVVGVKHLPPTREAGAAWLAKHLPNGGDVLVFVHGYNNRYEDAVFRFAQIVHDSDAEVAPVLFTWPSGARLLDYNYDRESTTFSRDSLERLLRVLAQAPRVHQVSVLAHSMGTWLTMEALRQMAIRDGRVAPKIKNVILASPDIDIDVFARQFRDLGPKHPSFTVFVAQDDRALAASRLVAGNVNRLGQINPDVEPYRSAAEKAGITFIDLTKLKTGGSAHHDKFASSPQIVKAIGTRLVEGQTLTESTIGLGDAITLVAARSAKAVGTGVGLAVSTPISVFDRSTQRNLASQADNLAKEVSGAKIGVDDQAGQAGGELLSGAAALRPKTRHSTKSTR